MAALLLPWPGARELVEQRTFRPFSARNMAAGMPTLPAPTTMAS